MAVQCANHPVKAAEGKCVECGIPICGECRTIVKSRPVCAGCLEVIRTNLVADIQAMPEPTPEEIAAQIESKFDLPPRPIHGRETESKTKPKSDAKPLPYAKKIEEPLPPLTRQRLITGILFGALVGTVGAWIWDHINLATGLKPGLVFLDTVFVCGLISIAVLVGTRRGGPVTAVVAALITLADQVLAYYLYFNDHNLRLSIEQGIPAQVLSVSQFLQMTPTIGPFGTLMIAVGVLTAYLVALHVRSGAQPKPMI